MKHNRDVCQGRSHSASSYGYGTAMRCPQECQPPPPKLPQTCSRGVQMTTPVVSMCQAPSCLKPSSPRPRPPPEPVVESDESDNGSLYCCQPSCCAPVCCEPACCETVDCDSDEGQQIYPRSQCRPPRSPPDQQQQNDCECSLVSSQCRQRDNTLPLSLQCPFDPNVRNTKKIKKKRKCRPCVWVVTHEMGVNTDNPCFVDEEVQADSGMGEETAVVRVGGVTKQETETKHRSGEREIDVTEVQEFTIFPNDGSRPQTDVITTNKVTKIMPSGETFVLGSVMSQTHFEEDEGTTEEILNKTKGALDSLDPSLNQQVVESMKSGLRTQVPISGNASRRSSDPAQRMGQSIATVSATASRRPSNPTAKINQAKTALSEMERAATPSFSGPPSAGASRRGSDLCTKTSPGKNNLSTVVTPSSAVGSRRSSDHTQPNYHREMSGRSSPPKNYDYDPVKTRKVKVTEVTSSALAGASRSSATKSGGAAAIPRSTKTKRKLLLDEKLPLQDSYENDGVLRDYVINRNVTELGGDEDLDNVSITQVVTTSRKEAALKIPDGMGAMKEVGAVYENTVTELMINEREPEEPKEPEPKKPRRNRVPSPMKNPYPSNDVVGRMERIPPRCCPSYVSWGCHCPPHWNYCRSKCDPPGCRSYYGPCR